MLDATPLTGKHLIAGDWVGSGATFASDPVSGDAVTVCSGGAAEIDAAVQAAEEAFATYGWTDRETRAKFLEAIAEEIEARGAALTAHGSAETGLPEARLEGERGRTTGQLRMFAEHIRKGDYLDIRHDAALPDRQPLPRPDLRLIQRPLGPVGVFGASNFPLAFSTAGGEDDLHPEKSARSVSEPNTRSCMPPHLPPGASRVHRGRPARRYARPPTPKASAAEPCALSSRGLYNVLDRNPDSGQTLQIIESRAGNHCFLKG